MFANITKIIIETLMCDESAFRNKTEWITYVKLQQLHGNFTDLVLGPPLLTGRYHHCC